MNSLSLPISHFDVFLEINSHECTVGTSEGAYCDPLYKKIKKPKIHQ